MGGIIGRFYGSYIFERYLEKGEEITIANLVLACNEFGGLVNSANRQRNVDFDALNLEPGQEIHLPPVPMEKYRPVRLEVGNFLNTYLQPLECKTGGPFCENISPDADWGYYYPEDYNGAIFIHRDSLGGQLLAEKAKTGTTVEILTSFKDMVVMLKGKIIKIEILDKEAFNTPDDPKMVEANRNTGIIIIATCHGTNQVMCFTVQLAPVS